MGKVIKVFVAAAVMQAGIGQALAAVDSSATAKPTPVEQHLMSSGVKIVQSFPSASGLKAIVADSGKEKRLFYVTPDGQSLLVGNVFDAKGANVTANDVSRAGIPDGASSPTLSAAQLQSLWSRAEKQKWVAEGSGPRVIYVLFDPNCPYCHRLWGTLREAVQQGKIQVRWLPVAILKEDSKALAAAIYAAKDPSQALAQMVNHQLQPIRVSDSANKDIAYNLLLLRDAGYTGVPTILYRQAGKIRTSMGFPTDQELATLIQ